MGKKKTQKELVLTYTESRYGGDKIDPSDTYSDREDTTIEFYILDIFVDDPTRKAREKCKNTWYTEILEYNFEINPGDQVWILVVRYSDGDSFGKTSGNWKIESVYASFKEAHSVEEMILEDEKLYREWKWGNPSYMGKPKEALPEMRYKKYKCWRDCSGGLEDVKVQSFTVI